MCGFFLMAVFPACLFVTQLEMKGQHSPPVVQLEMKGRHSHSPHSPPVIQFKSREHTSLSSPEDDPIVPLGIKPRRAEEDEVTREHDSAVVSRSEDSDNEDMDSMMYKVKTHTAMEEYDSDRSSVQSSAGSEAGFAPRQKASLVSEEYQLRRISIANTHL